MSVVRSAAKRRTGERYVLRGATMRPVGARSVRGNGFLSLATLDVLLGETTAFLLAAGLPRKKLVAELRTQARRGGAPGAPAPARGAGGREKGGGGDPTNSGRVDGLVDGHRPHPHTKRKHRPPP